MTQDRFTDVDILAIKSELSETPGQIIRVRTHRAILHMTTL